MFLFGKQIFKYLNVVNVVLMCFRIYCVFYLMFGLLDVYGLLILQFMKFEKEKLLVYLYIF